MSTGHILLVYHMQFEPSPYNAHRGIANTWTRILTRVQFAQELLSTFSTDLGEVALVPVTGGVFTVTIWHAGPSASGEATAQETLLWDRKRDGGFPGTSSFYSPPPPLFFFFGFCVFCAPPPASWAFLLFDILPFFRHRLELTCFPVAEVKALKSMVRNIIAPERDLGHTDRALKKAEEDKKKQETTEAKKDCEDCQ